MSDTARRRLRPAGQARVLAAVLSPGLWFAAPGVKLIGGHG